MAEKLTKMQAIKRYLDKGNEHAPVKLPELKEFKESCTPEQWDEYSKQAAKNLGVALKD